MKYILCFLFILCVNLIFSQKIKYYNLGRGYSDSLNTCLVIKGEPNILQKFSKIKYYGKYKIFKLINFKDNEHILDSVLTALAFYTKPEVLIFENCDLHAISKFPFTTVTEIRLLKNTLFHENSLFFLAKENPITKLCIQRNDDAVIMDSIAVLKNLTQINLSNTSSFLKVTNSLPYQFENKGVRKSLLINYFGTLSGPDKNHSMMQSSNLNEKTNDFSFVNIARPPFIKQPVSNVKINDTLYSFNGSQTSNLKYKSGSKIKIDKEAFVDQNGKPYLGLVKLFYREFRNPIEIMLSGIPMYNTVNGQDQLFRSGGMYELYAFDNNNNQLKTVSDTSVKINYALNDTSSSFKFYSLSKNGNWVETNASIKRNMTTVRAQNLPSSPAVDDYWNYFNRMSKKAPDTTFYKDRFADENYLYTYRKDNLHKNKDSINVNKPYSTSKFKGLFYVKFIKQTKEKEILFKIIPVANPINYFTPRHIGLLASQVFLYKGNLNKETFKRTYNRHVYCWDVRVEFLGEEFELNIKTQSGFITLSCVAVVQNQNGYVIPPKYNKILNYRFNRLVLVEARIFNHKRNRKSLQHLNTIKLSTLDAQKLAFEHCKKLKNQQELSMSFEAWKKYSNSFRITGFSYGNNSIVGEALLKSGMGISNIDEYIHNGSMEQIYVNYDGIEKNNEEQTIVMLYEKINTSYPLNQKNKGSFNGYYFKRQPNYLIRFSDGYMQVTKPKELNELKSGAKINVTYTKQHLVKDLDSDSITKLILD